MHTRNSLYNKSYNRQLIIWNLLRKKASRAELSRMTGLTRATITMIVDELIGEGFIRETQKNVANNIVGRNPNIIEIVPDCHQILCVDIARDDCHIGVVNFGGEVKFAKRINICNAVTPEAAVISICIALNKLIQKNGIDQTRILGLGITTPGPVDTVNGIIDDIPDFKLWCGFHIVDEFKKYFDINIRLERDANAITLAELFFGFGRKFDDFLSVSSYVGVGFGVVRNSRLYRGKLGLTPEIGHVSINMDGELCSCGNRGCLYLYYGKKRILDRVQTDFPDIESWEEIVDRADNGEKYFLNIIEYYAGILSIGIINAINMFEINKIVLSGFVVYRPDIFLNALNKHIRNGYITRNFFNVEIVVTEMKDNGNLIAAATGVIESYFELLE